MSIHHYNSTCTSEKEEMHNRSPLMEFLLKLYIVVCPSNKIPISLLSIATLCDTSSHYIKAFVLAALSKYFPTFMFNDSWKIRVNSVVLCSKVEHFQFYKLLTVVYCFGSCIDTMLEGNN